jgi:hypothetical protein
LTKINPGRMVWYDMVWYDITNIIDKNKSSTYVMIIANINDNNKSRRAACCRQG